MVVFLWRAGRATWPAHVQFAANIVWEVPLFGFFNVLPLTAIVVVVVFALVLLAVFGHVVAKEAARRPRTGWMVLVAS